MNEIRDAFSWVTGKKAKCFLRNYIVWSQPRNDQFQFLHFLDYTLHARLVCLSKISLTLGNGWTICVSYISFLWALSQQWYKTEKMLYIVLYRSRIKGKGWGKNPEGNSLEMTVTGLMFFVGFYFMHYSPLSSPSSVLCLGHRNQSISQSLFV